MICCRKATTNNDNINNNIYYNNNNNNNIIVIIIIIIIIIVIIILLFYIALVRVHKDNFHIKEQSTEYVTFKIKLCSNCLAWFFFTSWYLNICQMLVNFAAC